MIFLRFIHCLPTVTAVFSSYVIQVDNEEYLAELLNIDDSIVQAESYLRPNIKDNITIGSFQAIIAELDDSLISRINSSSLVRDILPNFEYITFGSQQNAPRHLARLSSEIGLYKKLQPYNYNYNSNGEGAVVYVVDSGVAIGHPEFEGRALRGFNFVNNESDEDLFGHGTHVAGIVGSKTYGVAKGVSIIDVKVMDRQGRGSLSQVLKGLEFAANDRRSRGVPGVVNLSLGGYFSGIMNDAVDATVDSGLPVVVAAGNFGHSADFYSPASAPKAITIAAIDDSSDRMAYFSNYGSKVATFASGVNVESVDSKSVDSSIQMSGTSMASPVVAGWVATLLSSGVDSENVKDRVISQSIMGPIIIDSETEATKMAHTPNRISYNGFGIQPQNRTHEDPILGTYRLNATSFSFSDKVISSLNVNVDWKWIQASAARHGLLI